jgi:hypothetical protein
MTPQQARRNFTITEDEDPVASLLTKYGKPDAGKAVVAKKKELRQQFFRVSAAEGKFPEGVTSADVRATHGIIYEIGLHYSYDNVRKMHWQGITYPYLAKYGKPREDADSHYVWDDGRTHLNIEASGGQINGGCPGAC